VHWQYRKRVRVCEEVFALCTRHTEIEQPPLLLGVRRLALPYVGQQAFLAADAEIVYEVCVKRIPDPAECVESMLDELQ
jgi:hypothetical protein